MKAPSSGKQVRYAIVGLGHISQSAMLPAFANAKNSKLVAFVSDDPVKMKVLGKRYGVTSFYSYKQYEECLQSGEVDAVYIGLPNSMHREYTVKAAQAGVHVLCEKPMAVTERECEDMTQACAKNKVKLMLAYRLHFEEANLKAVALAKSGRLGDIRFFSSTFSQVVKPGDIRFKKALGGGDVEDMGVYCINATRYLFGAEPEEVTAFKAKTSDPRFREVGEMTSVLLKFPGNRLATFTSSMGAADTSSYRVVGTKGDLRMEPAYDYSIPLTAYITINGKTKTQRYKKRDQFAAELFYFSDCVLKDKAIEPSGEEGLADVRIIEAIHRSARMGRAVSLKKFVRHKRPTLRQEISRPASTPPADFHAESPSGN